MAFAGIALNHVGGLAAMVSVHYFRPPIGCQLNAIDEVIDLSDYKTPYHGLCNLGLNPFFCCG